MCSWVFGKFCFRYFKTSRDCWCSPSTFHSQCILGFSALNSAESFNFWNFKSTDSLKVVFQNQRWCFALVFQNHSVQKFSWIQFFDNQGTSVCNRKYSSTGFSTDLQKSRQTGTKSTIFHKGYTDSKVKISSRLCASWWKLMLGGDCYNTS